MTDINNVTIIGNMTRDLDENSFAYTSGGTARANISLAVNRSVKKGDSWQDEASYFDVTIWGKTAENLKPYLVKGQKIAVQGYLKQDRWEKDGEKRSRISIVAETVQLVGGKRENGNPAPAVQNNAPVQQNYQQNTQATAMDNGSAYQEDILF